MRRVLVIVVALVLAIAACGGGDDDSAASTDDGGSGSESAVSAGDPVRGEELFATCVACHGEGGKGIEGLGKPMPGSAFIAGLSDEELVDFIKVGRGPSDPENTTGVDMPAKGGNPSLNDQDLLHIVAYIRTLG